MDSKADILPLWRMGVAVALGMAARTMLCWQVNCLGVSFEVPCFNLRHRCKVVALLWA